MIILLIILFLLTGPLIITFAAIDQSKLSRKEKWIEARNIFSFVFIAILITYLHEKVPKEVRIWFIPLCVGALSYYFSYMFKRNKQKKEIEPEDREEFKKP